MVARRLSKLFTAGLVLAMGALGAPVAPAAAATPTAMPLADGNLSPLRQGRRFRHREQAYEFTYPYGWSLEQNPATNQISLQDARGEGNSGNMVISMLTLDDEPDERAMDEQLDQDLAGWADLYAGLGDHFKVVKRGRCRANDMPGVWAVSAHSSNVLGEYGQLDVMIFHGLRRWTFMASSLRVDFNTYGPTFLGIIGSLQDAE